MRVKISTTLMTAAVVLARVVPVLAGVSVTATVNRTSVPVGENFVLTIEISGASINAASDPELPAMAAFASFLQSSTNSNIQWINGRMSSTRSIQYYFAAVQVGKHTIGPAKVNVGGKTYTTQPIQMTVTKGQAAPGPGKGNQPAGRTDQSITDQLMLRAETSKRTVYQNEPVVVTWKLYTMLSVTSYGANKLPNTAGFWAEEFELPKQPRTREEIINGRRYVVAEIKKTALFPTNTGELEIGPLQVECQVRTRTRPRGQDFFDSFFDDPFSRRTVPRVIQSQPLKIKVKPLPVEGRPAAFTGLVGRFKMTASVDRTEVEANEAVTLKLHYSGVGNIKAMPEPVLDIPPDFERYDPKVSEKISRTGDAITGARTYEYVLIPRFPGQHRIKPIQFSYFDPRARRYRVVTSPEFVINAAKGAQQFVARPGGWGKEEVKFLGKDIRYIKTTDVRFEKAGSMIYESPAFYAAFLMPALLLLGSLGYRQHLNKLSGNVVYARRRRALSNALAILRHAKKMMKPAQSKEFYGEVSRAMTSYVGDVLNISGTGIVSDEVEETLRAQGLPEEGVGRFVELLRKCDFYRFAPGAEDSEDMRALHDLVRASLTELDKHAT